MPGTLRKRRSSPHTLSSSHGNGLLDFRQTLHDLNQRYKQEWDRAERLRDELDHIKKSRAYRVLCWWCRLARFMGRTFLSTEAPATESVYPLFPTEYLDDCRTSAAGTVSILIPFRD